MKKHGTAMFLNAIFIMLVAIPTFTVFRPIDISGQTVQQKQDAVQLAAHVSMQPADTRVYGMTPRRLWATTAAVLALLGVVIGGLALRDVPPVVSALLTGEWGPSWPWWLGGSQWSTAG